MTVMPLSSSIMLTRIVLFFSEVQYKTDKKGLQLLPFVAKELIKTLTYKNVSFSTRVLENEARKQGKVSKPSISSRNYGIIGKLLHVVP